MGIIKYLTLRSGRLCSRVVKGTLINGGIFLGSALISFKFLAEYALHDGWLMRSFYYCFWVYPLLLLSFLISNRIWMDISDESNLIFLPAVRRDRPNLPISFWGICQKELLLDFDGMHDFFISNYIFHPCHRSINFIFMQFSTHFMVCVRLRLECT